VVVKYTVERKYINRISRIQGQLSSISRKIADQDDIVDIIAQVLAVAGAVQSLKVVILKDHLEVDDMDARKQAILKLF